MLSSLRRSASGVEAYECRTCGRPLLTQDAACPLCSKQKSHASNLLNPAIQQSALPVAAELPLNDEKLSSASVFNKLSTLVSIAGITLSAWLLTGPDLRTNLFQAFIVLALSLQLKCRA